MVAKSRFRGSMKARPPGLPGSLGGLRSVLVATVLAVFVVAWAATNLILGGEGFAVLVSDKVVGGEEAASALARLFAALVLGLFLADAVGWRARWVAGGLVVLGLGHLIFGYLEPLIQEDPPELNESLYESFVTQTLVCALFMVGLFPGRPPRLLIWAATIIPISLVVGYVVLFEFLHAEELDAPFSARREPGAHPDAWLAPGLTPWHWALSTLPLGLAAAAVVGAFWQSRRGLLRSWLLIAVVLLAGSVLHDYLWPSAYGGSLLTTAYALSLVFGGCGRRYIGASTRRLGACKALSHQAGTRAATERAQRSEVRLQRDDCPRVRDADSRCPQAQRDALCRGGRSRTA